MAKQSENIWKLSKKDVCNRECKRLGIFLFIKLLILGIYKKFYEGDLRDSCNVNWEACAFASFFILYKYGRITNKKGYWVNVGNIMR